MCCKVLRALSEKVDGKCLRRWDTGMQLFCPALVSGLPLDSILNPAKRLVPAALPISRPIGKIPVCAPFSSFKTIAFQYSVLVPIVTLEA